MQAALISLRAVWRLLVAALFCAVMSHPSHAADQGSVTLTLPQARALAASMIRQQKPKAAREIALGILRGDPDDIPALLLLSQAEARLGRPAKARFAARRAFRKADAPNQKFAAAALVADSFAQQDRLNETQIWLRRAEPYAQSEPQKAALARNYAKVRNANPFSLRLSFNVKPTDNLNNAPTDGQIIIGGLPFELSGSGRALSGTEVAYGLDLQYSKPTKTGNRWSLGLAFDARDYVLSSQAKAQAPTAKRSDFSFRELEASARYTWIGEERSQTTLRFSSGTNWYGGDRLTDSIGTGLSYRWYPNPRTAMDVALNYTARHRRDAPARSSDVTQLSLAWTRSLENKGRLRLSTSVVDTASASSFVAYEGITFGGAYTLGTPVLGATTQLSASYSLREYDRATGIYGSAARKDNQLSAGVTVLLKEAGIYGFAPTITLSASKTASNLDLYDTKQFGISFGIASVF